MMTKKLTFLHTAASNVTTFDRLVREVAPDIPVEHLLDERLLADARAAGSITPALAQRIEARILDADAESATVLCTCSTIGGAAEQITHPTAGPVLRVDRAMAEATVATGPRILVAAALASTLAPTRELILEVARQQGKSVEITELLCEGAWSKFEAGDQQGYWQAIADALQSQELQVDVIVLAQASMAGAAELCPGSPIPILSSPRLGLEAAIRHYRTVTGG